MASTWEKVKQLYLYLSKMQHRLIPPVVLIFLVIIVVHWMSRPVPGIVFPLENDPVFAKLQDKEIESTINGMSDVRSDICKNLQYDGLQGDKISIILDFKDHQFYDLKMTLESIMKHTPFDMIEEIIILDDGTDHEGVRKDAVFYLGHEKFAKKMKAFRSEKSDGSTVARFKAAKVATGSILVFLSNHVLVNVGWLQPLIALVQDDRSTFAVAHADALLSDYRFYPTPDNYTYTFTWDFRIVVKETKEKGRVLNTPVMPGTAFAVDKDNLEKLGHLDENFERDGGGENLELSFRAWLCGGSIQISTCSRVAVRNALHPLEVTSGRNFRRIAELWLGDSRNFAYRQGKFDFESEDDSERFLLRNRKNFFKSQNLVCHPFESFLKMFQGHVFSIPEKSRFYGKVRSDSGRCISSHASPTGRATMRLCRQWLYEEDMMFSLDISGRLRHGDQCMEMIESKEIYLLPCSEKSLNKATQLWQYVTATGQIQSAFDTTLCLTHMIDTDKSHYMGIQKCSDDTRENLWQFIKY